MGGVVAGHYRAGPPRPILPAPSPRSARMARPPSHHRSRRSAGPLVFVAAAVGVYALVFFPAWSVVGPTVGAFGVLPALLAAWWGGRWWGLWTGAVVGGPLHLALYSVGMPELEAVEHVVATAPTAAVFGLVGYGLGRIRELAAAVRTSEREFRGTFENAAVGMAHVAPDGGWLRVNGRLTEILGYTRAELLGSTFQDVTHPDDLDLDLAHVQRVLDGDVDSYQMEKRYLHRDGHTVWATLTVSAVRDAAGGVGHMISVVEDVSERKAAEAAARASETRYQDLVETVRDAVLQTDLEGRWTYLNPAWEQITGFSVAETLGRPVLEFVHPEERDRHDDLFVPLVREEVPFVRFETRYLTRSGGTRHVEVHVHLQRDEGGAVVGMAGTVSDITDTVRFEAEREARERTEEMLQLKSSFLNNMSHELRTPLTGIIGFADVLAEEAPPDLAGPVSAIQRGADRLMGTLTSVLDLAQIEAEGVRLHPEPVDVTAEARDVAAGLGAVAAQRGLALAVEGAATHAVLDRAALHRVLNNLVGNALKFTDAGRVTVRVEERGGAVRVAVADTGRGIDPAFVPRLFDEFRQESEGLDRAHEGNGLGLTITKRLVDLMGGAVEVESEVGVGTTFTVSLPLVSLGGGRGGAGSGAGAPARPRREAAAA